MNKDDKPAEGTSAKKPAAEEPKTAPEAEAKKPETKKPETKKTGAKKPAKATGTKAAPKKSSKSPAKKTATSKSKTTAAKKEKPVTKKEETKKPAASADPLPEDAKAKPAAAKAEKPAAKAEGKKPAPAKAEAKKSEPAKAKKAEPAKAAAKKPEPAKAAAKKPEPAKAAAKKPEPAKADKKPTPKPKRYEPPYRSRNPEPPRQDDGGSGRFWLVIAGALIAVFLILSFANSRSYRIVQADGQATVVKGFFLPWGYDAFVPLGAEAAFNPIPWVEPPPELVLRGNLKSVSDTYYHLLYLASADVRGDQGLYLERNTQAGAFESWYKDRFGGTPDATDKMSDLRHKVKKADEANAAFADAKGAVLDQIQAMIAALEAETDRPSPEVQEDVAKFQAFLAEMGRGPAEEPPAEADPAEVAPPAEEAAPAAVTPTAAE